MKNHRAFAAVILGLAAMLCVRLPLHAHAQSSPSTVSPSNVSTETQPGFTVVGFTVRTSQQKEAGGTGLIPQLWQRVMEQGLVENVPHRADNNLTVVYTNYSSDQNGEYTYVLGVRVSAVDKVPDGMTAIQVPAGKYAIVTSDTGPLPDIIPKLWQRIWAMSAAELGGQRAFKADFEIYPEGFDWQNAQVAVHLGLK
ncbi:MAG: GyrI-like domain-containing protein [Silvibacterium sp.]